MNMKITKRMVRLLNHINHPDHRTSDEHKILSYVIAQKVEINRSEKRELCLTNRISRSSQDAIIERVACLFDMA